VSTNSGEAQGSSPRIMWICSMGGVLTAGGHQYPPFWDPTIVSASLDFRWQRACYPNWRPERVNIQWSSCTVMRMAVKAQKFRQSSLLQQLRTQKRVIGALIMREVQMRYGREGLGAGWIVAEPLIFVFPVMLMWSFIRSRSEHDIPVMELCWTGYLPLMLFRHVGGLLLHSVSNNSAMLYHRLVTPFDILIAKVLMEVGQNLLALVFSFFVLHMLGVLRYPADPTMFLVGYLYMIWWCAAVGVLIASLSERSVWVEKIWAPLSYMYIAVSGCFYLAFWLPQSVRNIALLQPSLQAYEMIRAGMLGNVVPTYGDPAYATAALAVLTLLGLIFTYDVRKHMKVD